ncbi:MAG: hypothetical protein ACK58L_14320 [Planctomycetota bacterium]
MTETFHLFRTFADTRSFQIIEKWLGNRHNTDPRWSVKDAELMLKKQFMGRREL